MLNPMQWLVTRHMIIHGTGSDWIQEVKMATLQRSKIYRGTETKISSQEFADLKFQVVSAPAITGTGTGSECLPPRFDSRPGALRTIRGATAVRIKGRSFGK